MTIIARPVQQTQETPHRVRIQASESLFFQSFAQGYHLARYEQQGQTISDDSIYGAIRRVMARPELSPRWKAGAITGWFAALYHIPCRFEDENSTPRVVFPVHSIELYYTHHEFLTAFSAGYEAFEVVIGEQPATDAGLYAELARDYLPTLDQPTLVTARWCAGYLAGFMAALFRVPALVEEHQANLALVMLERSNL